MTLGGGTVNCSADPERHQRRFKNRKSHYKSGKLSMF